MTNLATCNNETNAASVPTDVEAPSVEDSMEPTLDDEAASTVPDQALLEKEVEEMCNTIDKYSEDWKKALRDRPEVFVPAFQRFFQRADEASKSENSLLSALHNFNRFPQNTPARKPSAENSCSSSNLSGWGMRRMNVQPTAIGRRTAYLGGREAKIPGRPAASISNASKRSQEPNYANLPTKKRKLPHNISQCALSKIN